MSVEHNDESHESFESSSSLLPNHDDGFVAADALRLYRAPTAVRADFRRNPSIALPIICGSTNELLLSQRSLDLDFFGFSSLSLKRSITSFENDTVKFAVFRSDFFRAIGWWRFSNQPDNELTPLLSVADAPPTRCLALCSTDTSKLLDRFEREMPLESGANVFADDVDGFAFVGVDAPHLLISVADDAIDVINDFISVLVTTMPVRLKKLGDRAGWPVDVDGVTIAGFSDARLTCDPDGIGVNVEPTKSEKRRAFV